MSEQTLSEALADIDIDLDIKDEDIKSAAIPANLEVQTMRFKMNLHLLSFRMRS